MTLNLTPMEKAERKTQAVLDALTAITNEHGVEMVAAYHFRFENDGEMATACHTYLHGSPILCIGMAHVLMDQIKQTT